ncbi:MAG: hypothetical protein K6E19_11670 [Lachnospiraceae bacterium]|nr:hypothetical protein [Lachnospiraceae bacterium]
MNKNAGHRIIIPIVHFLLTFLFERFVFIFKDYGDIVTPVAKSSVISLSGERVMGYVIAKILAAFLIFALWKLVFYIKDNISKAAVKGFLILFAVSFVVILVCFPDCFGYGVYGEYSDNLITFSYGLRFLPEYWHSAYSSLIYAASMEVIPTPFAIPVIQLIFLIFDLGYVYLRVTGEFKPAGVRKIFWILIFILPESWFLLTYAYRTEGYAVVCMFFFSLVLLDIITGRKRNTLELIGIAGLAAFLSVWRTEGVILGFLGMGILLVANYRKEAKRAIPVACFYIVAFILISVPQKIGDMKYYGSDYTIINSFAVVRNIFNREDSNLSYPGATEDIEAIEAVVPIEAVRLYGLEGYRNYNVLMGHVDINQSIPGFEAGKMYSSAYRRLCLHNIKAYALTQIGKLKAAVKFSTGEYIEKIHGNFNLSREYPMFSFPAWEWGEVDIISFNHVRGWAELPIRKQIGTGIIRGVRTLESLMQKTYVATLIIAAVVVSSGICLICDFISIIRKKKKARINSCFFAVELVLFMEAAAIFAVMPAGVLSYFRAVLTCMFLVLYIRLTAFSSQYLQR